MEYNEIFTLNYVLVLLTLLVVLITLIIINTNLNIILYSDINNSDVSINLNIKFMFIDIKKQIYPNKTKKIKKTKKKKVKKKKAKNNTKETKDKKRKNKKGNIKFNKNDIVKIYRLIKNIKVHELYSKIEFGTSHIQLTSFVYVLINSIYGIFVNYINPEKMYLGVVPDYTRNYIVGSFRIHITTTLKELINIGICILKILIKSKYKTKGGNKNEGNRVNTKFNGNNS